MAYLREYLFQHLNNCLIFHCYSVRNNFQDVVNFQHEAKYNSFEISSYISYRFEPPMQCLSHVIFYTFNFLNVFYHLMIYAC